MIAKSIMKDRKDEPDMRRLQRGNFERERNELPHAASRDAMQIDKKKNPNEFMYE